MLRGCFCWIRRTQILPEDGVIGPHREQYDFGKSLQIEQMPSDCSKVSRGRTVNDGSLIASPHSNGTVVHEHHLFFGLLVCTDSRLEKELLFCFLAATLGIVYEICQAVTQNGPYYIFCSCDFLFSCIKLWARQCI